MEKKTKQIKFICPNRCGSFRMLNGGSKPVTLALCHNPNCNLAMMIPEHKKEIKTRKKNKNITLKPMLCTSCHGPSHILTIIKEGRKVTDELCHDCLVGEKSGKICSDEIVKTLVEEEYGNTSC